MKQSKNTIALRANNPTLRDWVINNLTVADLAAIGNALCDTVSFGNDHPLNDEKLAAAVFRAYRQEAIGCIQYQFESLEHFGEMRGQRTTWDAFYHHALITAIAFMVEENPEMLTLALGATPIGV